MKWEEGLGYSYSMSAVLAKNGHKDQWKEDTIMTPTQVQPTEF